MVRIGTRVPRNTGLPPRISGSLVMTPTMSITHLHVRRLRRMYPVVTENSVRSENTGVPTICEIMVVPRHGKFVLTDDRSMIDWGAFGAPRRVDCDDLYRQPQTALQHRRISLCVRPAVREEEVAMVR